MLVYFHLKQHSPATGRFIKEAPVALLYKSTKYPTQLCRSAVVRLVHRGDSGAVSTL